MQTLSVKAANLLLILALLTKNDIVYLLGIICRVYFVLFSCLIIISGRCRKHPADESR